MKGKSDDLARKLEEKKKKNQVGDERTEGFPVARVREGPMYKKRGGDRVEGA